MTPFLRCTTLRPDRYFSIVDAPTFLTVMSQPMKARIILDSSDYNLNSIMADKYYTFNIMLQPQMPLAALDIEILCQVNLLEHYIFGVQDIFSSCKIKDCGDFCLHNEHLINDFGLQHGHFD